MDPSCSHYAEAAFARAGVIEGLWATCDRLNRCGNDLHLYEPRVVSGVKLCVDPPPAALQAKASPLAFHGGDSGREMKPTSLLAFADSLLLRDRDYFRAITEYKRALYFSSANSDTIRPQAVLGIGRALYEGEAYGPAAEWMEGRLGELPRTTDRRRGHRLLFRSLIKSRAVARAVAWGDRLDTPEADYYPALALATAGEWEAASGRLSQIPEGHPYREDARYNMKRLDEARKLHFRSPGLAAALNVVPGAGYLYAGHPKSAFSALLFNSLLMFATYEAFDSDQHALGGFLGILSLTWYTSGFYGAPYAARRYNSHLIEVQLATMRF